MKSLFFIMILNVLIVDIFALVLTEVKIDQKWKVRYDSKDWSYAYLKPMSAVTSNIFEHKKTKLKLILQKETHILENIAEKNILALKCKESNKYYNQNFKGHTEILKINNVDVCYVEYRNIKGVLAHQILYPELPLLKNYEVYSYAWNSEDPHTKEIVLNFLKGFLR